MEKKQNFLEGLSRKRYLEVLKSLPSLQKERVKQYGTLILTFVALSFFSIFAINPTLSTITDLRKQLEDNQEAAKALETKIKNLTTLQQAYTTLTPDLGFVQAAIPSQPQAIDLLGKVQSIAKVSNVQVQVLQVSDVSLLTQKQSATKRSLLRKAKVTTPSFSFLVRVAGANEEILTFLSSLLSFDRIVTIESITLVTDVKQGNLPAMTVRAKAYYMP